MEILFVVLFILGFCSLIIAAGSWGFESTSLSVIWIVLSIGLCFWAMAKLIRKRPDKILRKETIQKEFPAIEEEIESAVNALAQVSRSAPTI